MFWSHLERELAAKISGSQSGSGGLLGPVGHVPATEMLEASYSTGNGIGLSPMSELQYSETMPRRGSTPGARLPNDRPAGVLWWWEGGYLARERAQQIQQGEQHHRYAPLGGGVACAVHIRV